MTNPSDIAKYPGRPFDFGATIGGAGAGALFSNNAFGVGAGALASASTPGSFYMLALPTVLSSWACYIQGLALAGDQVTYQLFLNGVNTRTLLCTFDDSIAAPFPGGRYVSLVFTPLIVSPRDRIAIQWPNLGGEVLPGLTVGFLQ